MCNISVYRQETTKQLRMYSTTGFPSLTERPGRDVDSGVAHFVDQELKITCYLNLCAEIQSCILF